MRRRNGKNERGRKGAIVAATRKLRAWRRTPTYAQGDETTPLSKLYTKLDFQFLYLARRPLVPLFISHSFLLFHRAIPNTSRKRMQSFRWITGVKGKGAGRWDERKKVALRPLRPLGFIYILLQIGALSRRRARIEIAKLSWKNNCLWILPPPAILRICRVRDTNKYPDWLAAARILPRLHVASQFVRFEFYSRNKSQIMLAN